MGLFGRRRRGGPERAELRAAAEHLTRFATHHTGVEAYLEPRTWATPATVILIAGDGEWTRRALDPPAAFALGRRLGIPVYEVAKLGYPRRMREYNARRRSPRT